MRGRANGYNKVSRIFTIRNKFKNFLSKWKVEKHKLLQCATPRKYSMSWLHVI